DGIREATVTGVQTCALPISDAREAEQQPEEGDPMRHAAIPGRAARPYLTPYFPQITARHPCRRHKQGQERAPRLLAKIGRPRNRSEERRVGTDYRYSRQRAQ